MRDKNTTLANEFSANFPRMALSWKIIQKVLDRIRSNIRVSIILIQVLAESASQKNVELLIDKGRRLDNAKFC